MSRHPVAQPNFSTQLIIDGALLTTANNVLKIHSQPESTLTHIICRNSEQAALAKAYFESMANVKLHAASPELESMGYYRPLNIDEDIHRGKQLTHVSKTQWKVQNMTASHIILSDSDKTITYTHAEFEVNRYKFSQPIPTENTPYNINSVRLPHSVLTTLTASGCLRNCPPLEALTIGTLLIKVHKRHWIIKEDYTTAKTITVREESKTTHQLTWHQFYKLLKRSHATTAGNPIDYGNYHIETPQTLTFDGDILVDSNNQKRFINTMFDPVNNTFFHIEKLPHEIILQPTDTPDQQCRSSYAILTKLSKQFMVKTSDCPNLAALLDLSKIQPDIATHIITKDAGQMVYLHEQLQAHLNPRIDAIHKSLTTEKTLQVRKIKYWLNALPVLSAHLTEHSHLDWHHTVITEISQILNTLKHLMSTTKSTFFTYDKNAQPVCNKVGPKESIVLTPNSLKEFMQHHQLTYDELAEMMIRYIPSANMELLKAKLTPLSATTSDVISHPFVSAAPLSSITLHSSTKQTTHAGLFAPPYSGATHPTQQPTHPQAGPTC